MIEVGQYPRFYVELLLCARRRIRAILDGTKLVHDQVFGQVDVTEATLAQQTLDLVGIALEGGASRQITAHILTPDRYC